MDERLDGIVDGYARFDPLNDHTKRILLTNLARDSYALAVKDAAAVAAGFIWDGVPKDGDEMDRIARYTNETARRIMVAIQQLQDPDVAGAVLRDLD